MVKSTSQNGFPNCRKWWVRNTSIRKFLIEPIAQYQPVDQLFPWSPRRLEYLLEDIGEEAALDKHLSFDMCRWTSTLIDYRAGYDTEKIRQKLGVSKIQWREINLKLKQLSKKA